MQVEPALTERLRGGTRVSRLLLTEGRGQEIREDVRKDKSSLESRASSPLAVCRKDRERQGEVGEGNVSVDIEKVLPEGFPQ